MRELAGLPFTKSFRKFWLESKWNTTFRVVQVEDFRKQLNTEKVGLFSLTEYFKQKSMLHFSKPIFETSFRLLRPVLGK